MPGTTMAANKVFGAIAGLADYGRSKGVFDGAKRLSSALTRVGTKAVGSGGLLRRPGFYSNGVIGAGIGAGLGAGNEYMNGRGDYGRGALRGAGIGFAGGMGLTAGRMAWRSPMVRNGISSGKNMARSAYFRGVQEATYGGFMRADGDFTALNANMRRV